jgi:hypothetical protein
MTFKPEMRRAVEHYRAMPREIRKREIEAMTYIASCFQHCLAAARRADKEDKRERTR